ncbi:hypothetical protein [Jiangella asiatica]|uniref:Uncharacterized protein n=1 Tax=Jiangella asiatica TaxID=2530372 RepID=A0A4R5DEA4_9ACTN|nr:hypothetical protein [Jiangella asiatica]TDE12202.1 hypothetical protein E1269_07885 [Jiangella asiatica]
MTLAATPHGHCRRPACFFSVSALPAFRLGHKETLKKRPSPFDGPNGAGTRPGPRQEVETMMRIRFRMGLAALPLVILVALTGCGSDDGSGDDDGSVASADGGTPSDSGDDGSRDDDSGDGGKPLSEDELHDRLLEYAQCLRDHGLDVEDPAPGEGIQIQNEGDPSKSDEAMAACEDVAPPSPPEGSEDDDREDMLTFAQCMRDNGVEAFKDPKPGEGINIGPEVAEDPDFVAAEQTCNDQVFGGQPDTQGGPS